jgi:hypothetical protein
VKHFLVATSHGTLMGVLAREDAERAVEEWKDRQSGR